MIGLKKKMTEELKEEIALDNSKKDVEDVESKSTAAPQRTRKRVSALAMQNDKKVAEKTKSDKTVFKFNDDDKVRVRVDEEKQTVNLQAKRTINYLIASEDEEEDVVSVDRFRSFSTSRESQKDVLSGMQQPEKVHAAEELTAKEETQIEDVPVDIDDSADTIEVPVEKTDGIKKSKESQDIISKLDRAVKKYVDPQNGFKCETISLRYASGVNEVKVDNGWIYFPIKQVFVNGRKSNFNNVHEVRLKRNDRVELDLGVSAIIPRGYVLEFRNVENAKTKFGIEVPDGTVIRAQDALYSMVVPVNPIDDLAYVCQNRSIVRATLKAV